MQPYINNLKGHGVFYPPQVCLCQPDFWEGCSRGDGPDGEQYTGRD